MVIGGEGEGELQVVLWYVPSDCCLYPFNRSRSSLGGALEERLSTGCLGGTKLAGCVGLLLLKKKVFLHYAVLCLLLGFLLLDPTLCEAFCELKRVKICYIGLFSCDEEIFCWKGAVFVCDGKFLAADSFVLL